jgi:tetratricopeptide (TPR) repeat protein
MNRTIRRTGFPLLLTGLLFSPALAAQPEPSAATLAYEEGQERLARRTPADINAARQHFELAIGADPNFAPAYAGLAEAHALLYDYRRAKEAALQALTLDDRLAAAHAVLGFARLHGDWDWAGAEASFRRALELDPGRPVPHLWYAILLEANGRLDESVAEARRAVDLAPRQAQTRAGLGYRLYWARRYDEAVEELKAALKLDPNFGTAHYFIGRARVQQGRFKEARAAFASARKLSPGDTNLLSAGAYLDVLSGKRDAARRILSELERQADRGLPFASQIAGLHAALGEKDAALRWLERAQQTHEGALVWLKVDPRFDSLRAEPRFTEILKRMGLAGS